LSIFSFSISDRDELCSGSVRTFFINSPTKRSLAQKLSAFYVTVLEREEPRSEITFSKVDKEEPCSGIVRISLLSRTKKSLAPRLSTMLFQSWTLRKENLGRFKRHELWQKEEIV
jgi:hypothetical protein